jgi:hypothetical protein
LPALPDVELRLTFSQSFEGARGPGKYKLTVDELAITRGVGSGRRVTLPSPRRVLNGLLTQAGRVFPLELVLLTELAPASGRELTCTALLTRAAPRVRVVRSSAGELRVFVPAAQLSAAALASERTRDAARVTAALPQAQLAAAGGGERQPVGLVDAKGAPIEELWVDGQSGLGDDWLGYGEYS